MCWLGCSCLGRLRDCVWVWFWAGYGVCFGGFVFVSLFCCCLAAWWCLDGGVVVSVCYWLIALLL